jgi:aminopeptidase N
MRPVALHDAREHVRAALACALQAEFEAVYAALDIHVPYEATPGEIGRRRLKNVCLSYLSTAKDGAAAQRALAAFEKANCMTDSLAALACLASLPGKEKEEALAAFYAKAGGDPLVLNKWFTIQALADLPDQVDRVVALTKHKVG